MARIGVFIDGLQGSIPSPFRKKIADMVREQPQVVFCAEEEDLASREGLERMSRHLDREKVDRVLVLGGSPRRYETSFHRWGAPSPLNPYLFSIASIQEQGLRVGVDEQEALESVRKIIFKNIRVASALRPIEGEVLSLKPDVLVIGGGAVGISISRALATVGFHVTLIEKSDSLGGNALSLWGSFSGPEDVQAWLTDQLFELRQNPNITLLTRTELKSLRGHVGRFEATVQTRDGSEQSLHPSAIVVAIGCEAHHDPQGIYRHRRIIPLTTMEKLLAESPADGLRWDGKKVDTVTFILDLENEDIKINSITALKQGLRLQEVFQCQTVMLSRDVKVSADGMERLYRKVREQGAIFFKYDTPPRLSLVNGHIQIDLQDTARLQKGDPWQVSILSDLVVIGDSYKPSLQTEELSRLLKLHLGPRGFFMEDNPQGGRVRSNRRGIFLAGGCRFPQELPESLVEAGAAVQEVLTLLSKGTYAYDLAVAEVDPKKCAVCYTCPRLCPHSAITVETYADQNVYAVSDAEQAARWGAAKVDPAACYGCGICVAECPARAITLRHLIDDQIYAEMGVREA
jgi:heterodisulfide reductase subunit A2